MGEIKDQITAIVANHMVIDSQLIDPSSSFSDDLGADSLDVVEMVMQIEAHFSIHIPDEQAVNINSVNSAARIVNMYL